MKILHYVDENNLSWAHPWVQLLDQLRERGFRNVVVCRPGGTLSALLQEAGFSVRYDKVPFSAFPRSALGFARIVRDEAPDLIHTRLSSAARIAGWWGERLGCPVLSTVDKYPKAKYYSRATHLLPCSASVAAHMASLGFLRERMTVLHNAIDVRRYRRDESVRARVRAEAGLDTDSVCFVGLGRFIDWKAFDDLIRAFALFLRDRKDQGRFHLWLVGDGEERRALTRLAQSLALGDRVRFWGYIGDVRPLLWGADIYVHPAWGQEAFGLSLLESMASGLAAIASDNGGMAEILGGGEFGPLFPIKDVPALAERMGQALEDLEPLRLKAVSRAHDFDVAAIADRTAAVYRAFRKKSRMAP